MIDPDDPKWQRWDDRDDDLFLVGPTVAAVAVIAAALTLAALGVLAVLQCLS